MATIKDLAAYLLKRSGDAGPLLSFFVSPELPSEKLARLVFLCDWKHSLDHGEQITDLEWSVSGFGSFGDVVNEVKKHPDLFDLRSYGHMYRPDEVVRLVDEDYQPELEDSEMDVAREIADLERKLNWAEFSQILYSTYPLLRSHSSKRSNLVELAKEYKGSDYYQFLKERKESEGISEKSEEDQSGRLEVV